MKRICICGNFSFKVNIPDGQLGGQLIKTRVICSELEKEYGADEVLTIDTDRSKFGQIITLIELFFALLRCKNIIILPAQKGVRVIAPFIERVNRLFNRKLHYVVIGGWLPEYVKSRKKLSDSLSKFNYIYVETHTMKNALDMQGFKNVIVMPNFKDLKRLNQEDLIYSHSPPFKLCTFSRVVKEKGIEAAVDAVVITNIVTDQSAFTLDIYGPIGDDYKNAFFKFIAGKPEIRYKGTIPYYSTTDVLKDYFALLFPTYYGGEGFPGTLLDAMSAGVPVIASDWKYNSEIITDGYNGIILRQYDADSISDVLIEILNNQIRINDMKVNALMESKKYLPEVAMGIIYAHIDQ